MAAPLIESRLGPIRQTYKGTTDFPRRWRRRTPSYRRSYARQDCSRERALLRPGRDRPRSRFRRSDHRVVLLGDSWFQLLIAAALGILFTQVASFLAHEAAHKQIFASGKANERLALWLAAGVVGMSVSWWSAKHTRHHANPNRWGKDPDIEIDTISFLDEDAAKARGIQRWITQRQGWAFFRCSPSRAPTCTPSACVTCSHASRSRAAGPNCR